MRRFHARKPALFTVALCVGVLILSPAAAQSAPTAQVTTFAQGAQGWQGPAGSGGGTAIDLSLGRPAPSLHTRFNDFGITFRNTRAMPLVRAISGGAPVEIGLDTKTFEIRIGARRVSRDLVLEFRDFDNPPPGLPYTSVWTVAGTLDPRQGGWRRFAVVIDDPTATALPEGWGGYGAEDPVTFEPRLPADRTFADVLANADEVVFTTLVPGYFYGFTDFDVALDNISIRRLSGR